MGWTLERKLESIKRRFSGLKEKRILIYGTGRIAERLLDALAGFKVVGIIDRICFEGEFNLIPVLTWDDLHRNYADVIIIAALKKNYNIIFDRIQYYCSALNIIIYGENGQNLTEEYQLKYINPSHAKYFEKNVSDLKMLIDQYDAISFDLFDTLVMRRTLEREDVFGIVEERIRNKGIAIPNFKKKRCAAQHGDGCNSISVIYENLKIKEGISDSEIMMILQEEIDCEEKCMISRRVMVDLMKYAVRKGKKVSIIEDTYFPKSIIERILTNLNITGYEKIYLSSEYDMKKMNWIFDLYQKDMGKRKCLHIGNEKLTDIIASQYNRIDLYGIKSAYELLRISSLRKLLLCSCGIENRVVLGGMIAEIFNNPFALYHTSGVVKITTFEEFSILFVTPIVLIYLQNLIRTIEKDNIDVILFTARDGYLFKKIYDAIFLKAMNIPSVYFLTSRKLCLKSTINLEKNILDLCKNFSTEYESKLFLEELFEKDLSIVIDKQNIDAGKILSVYRNILEQYSKKMRKNYLIYINKIGINQGEKYLFCELNSTGTVHEALNKILKMDLEGFYLYRRTGVKPRNLNIVSVYDDIHGGNIDRLRDLLEIVFTSDFPSISGMNEKGEPVYSFESRSERELNMVDKIHKLILRNVQIYVNLIGIDINIGKELPDIVLGLCDNVEFEAEAKDFVSQTNLDDMTQRRISILDKIGG